MQTLINIHNESREGWWWCTEKVREREREN